MFHFCVSLDFNMNFDVDDLSFSGLESMIGFYSFSDMVVQYAFERVLVIFADCLIHEHVKSFQDDMCT